MKKNFLLLLRLVVALVVMALPPKCMVMVDAFSSTTAIIQRPPSPTLFVLKNRLSLLPSMPLSRSIPLKASNNKDDGMENAFRELESLNESLDDENDVDITAGPSKDLEAALDAETLKQKTPSIKPEQEIERYTQMYKEAEDSSSDENLYSDVLKDMGGTPPKDIPEIPQVSTAATSDTDNDSSSSMDQFMNAALEQALKEAKDKTPEEIASLSENILDDESLMDEIRGVFEKGNQELLQGLEDIRQEQSNLAKASAEQSSKERLELEQENEERMAKAQESLQSVLETVQKESREVEKAVQELKEAQQNMENDSMMKLVSGDIVKQASLVGMLLFAVRAGAETVSMVGGGGANHAVAALVQGAIAIACAVIFFS